MEDLTGKQFGPYQIIAPLGEGGMAAVYKAYQPSMDRYVALKVLPRHFADDPQFTSRFQREAKLLAQLQHPHILPVFDYGQADGYSYIVMPFVQGGTLMDSLMGQPLPLQQIRQVITQVAGALNYAHSHGLIHRDVKPSNVLIDESGNYLLSDFGLARMVETSMNLTASGAIVGTPTYMSPEQGSGLKLDGRSDIYSLGVILYELATGRVPYRAETPIAVIVKHINDPLPPPRTINPQLPEAMERVILKALAKDPVDRFQTVAEMIQAVEVASSSEAEIVSAQAAETKNVMHKTVSPITHWRKIWEMPRGKVALVSGAVVVLVLGLLVSRLSAPPQVVGPDTTHQVVNGTVTPLDTSLTSLPLIPSRTPVPTRTMGPTNTPSSPGEAFAAPILAAIADRPPDFEDDFSTDKGWREGRGWTTPSIQDEQLYLQVGANIDWMTMINPTIRYLNFVMVVDSTVQEFAGNNTVIAISWGAWSNSMNFDISTVQTWNSSWCGPTATCPEVYESGPVRLEKDVPVDLMVIVRGNEWAAYVDGALLAYVNDSAHSVPDDFIALRGWADAETRSAIITYDNFKIWNLADVPGLP